MMRSIYTAGRNVTHRLPSWCNPSQPCTRWPVLRFNTSLIRAQHDAPHSQEGRSTSRPQADVQQPLPIDKKPQSALRDTKINTDDSPAGPAQGVSGQSSQTPTTDTRDASQPCPPFTCEECGSNFRTQQGLRDHQLINKSQQGLRGQAGGCKHRLSVAGLKVNPRVLKHQDPRDLRLTVGLGEKILEISSRDLEPSPVVVSQDSGYQVVSTFDIKPGEASRISVPGQ